MQAWSPSVAHFKGTCSVIYNFSDYSITTILNHLLSSCTFPLYRVYKESLVFRGLLSAVRFPDLLTVQDLCISSMQRSLLPLQLQTVSATTVFLPYPSRRPNRRVREPPQPFPASSFPASVSTQLKPQNKQATNKNRIDRVAESPHPDSVKVCDYLFPIKRESSPTQLLKKGEILFSNRAVSLGVA